jgi:hypothetical protein
VKDEEAIAEPISAEEGGGDRVNHRGGGDHGEGVDRILKRRRSVQDKEQKRTEEHVM